MRIQPKEERKHFKADILAESGIDQNAFNAKLATNTVCSEASGRHRSFGKATGVYLDPPELAKKFEGKPEQLKHARERTGAKDCETRGVTL